jgi:serine/threonine protein kinase
VFDEAKVRKLLQDVLPVLQFIHSQQIIHRDIKPENIMRKSQGGDLIVIDFGIAKSIAMNAWMKTGTVTGSPEYMPPEQMRGKVLPASDLYSLGVTCIYLLTGISPFQLFDDTSDRWVWRDFLPPDHGVTNQLASILDKMIQNAISQRYQSAEEVLTAIKVSGSSIKKSPVNSVMGLDYSKLRNFLASKQWQKADEETWLLMCLAVSKKSANYLSSSDIEKLPCEDFEIIDSLWTKYSQGHFGFSIQAQIYNNFNGDYGRFCAAVGWYLPYSITQNIKLTFSLSAPQGHLPSHVWVSGTQVGRQMKVLTAKVASCYN